MKPVSSTDGGPGPLQMKVVNGQAIEKFKVPANKIGWVHSVSDKPGASFDLTFRDAMGRIIFQQPNCKTETNQFGQFIGLDMRMGEEIEVSLENIKGAQSIDLFLN